MSTHTDTDSDDINDRAAAVASTDINLEAARQIQADIEHEQAEKIAFRRLIYGIGEAPGDELGPVEAAYETIAHVQDLTTEVAQLRDSVAELQRDVETAMTIAEQQATDGNTTKQRAARLSARDELVRRLALDRSCTSGASITASDTQQMLKPELKVHYQTVKDAWDGLAADWSAFRVAETEDGTAALKIDADAVDESLVTTVEANLERDDLTKRLLSEGRRGGR